MIGEVLAEAGADTKSFAEFASGEGRAALDTVHSRADQFGVFGMLTIVLDGESFWGREQFPMVRLRLNELGLPWRRRSPRRHRLPMASWRCRGGRGLG